eukprot:SAG31_NODE_513_length_14715_cov_22.844554_10_plen_82_part_00
MLRTTAVLCIKRRILGKLPIRSVLARHEAAVPRRCMVQRVGPGLYVVSCHILNDLAESTTQNALFITCADLGCHSVVTLFD